MKGNLLRVQLLACENAVAGVCWADAGCGLDDVGEVVSGD